MVYYLAVGLKTYGGEDGLTLIQRSQIGFGIDTADEATLYYIVLAALAGTMFLLNRAVQARFGRALIGIRENEARMATIARCAPVAALLARERAFPFLSSTPRPDASTVPQATVSPRMD